MEFAAEEKAPQGLVSAPENNNLTAEWNSTAEAEKAPQGLVSDRSPRKAKTLRVWETLRV